MMLPTMKKMLSFILLCFLLIVPILAAGKKHKHKHPPAAQETMRLPTEFPLHNILGKNREKMIEQIQTFPTHSYQLFYVPKNGYYYLDTVDDYIKNLLKQGKTWEGHIQKLIHQHTKPGSTVLDIGAHIGTHTLTLSEAVGPTGQVIAFEPQPKIFRELFMNMAINQLNNISFYWAGVGNKEGTIQLAPLHPTNEGGTPLISGTGETVPLLTIDSLNLTNVSLIKIDVEGMENLVLDGATHTILTNHPVIIIEIMGGHDFATAPSPIRHQILNTLDKIEHLGYTTTQLWGHDWLALPTHP